MFNKLGPANLKIVSKVVWLVSTGRNALIVITCALIAYSVDPGGTGTVFLLTGEISGGLPRPQVPPFGFVSSPGTGDDYAGGGTGEIVGQLPHPRGWPDQLVFGISPSETGRIPCDGQTIQGC